MPYSNALHKYDIDLLSPPNRRWSEVIDKEEEVMCALGAEALDSVEEELGYWDWLMNETLYKLFSARYSFYGGRYAKEMKHIASGLGVSPALAVVLNCSYELSRLFEGVTPFGCTAGVKWLPGTGMIHVRNMDWPLQRIGPATCLFRYAREGHSFTSVGVAGLVGVLSGMVPGQYSVTINWAPALEVPSWGWGPLFLLRYVMETCDTYEEAVETLANSLLATPAFYMVCGTKRGQACVLERTEHDCEIREMGNSTVLTHSNHFQSPKLESCNEPLYEEEEGYELLIENSTDRSENLRRRLRAAKSYEAVVRSLDYAPQHNENSYQQMVFMPKPGRVDAWRFL